MHSAIEILRRERESAADEAKALRMRVKQLDAAIELLEGSAAAKATVKAEGDVKTLVMDALIGAGKDGMFAKDIATLLTEGGRKTSEASVSSTLSRLKAVQKVFNEKGMWFAASGALNLEVRDEYDELIVPNPPPYDDDLDPDIGF